MIFVNYVNIYECNMNFVCDMHAWIVDIDMNGRYICFYPFIRVSTDLILYVFQIQILYVFQIQITNEIRFF